MVGTGMWHNAAVRLRARQDRAVASIRSTLSSVRSRARPSRYRLIIALVIGVILVNLIELPVIERQIPWKDMRAFGRYGTSDIAVIAYQECAWCRQRYGLAMSLGAVAPGARVIIPTPTPILGGVEGDETPARLRVFGRASSVELVEYNANSLPGFDATPFILASGDGGERGGPWALAVDPQYLPAGGVQDPDSFLIDRITGEGPTRSEPVREFVLVRWYRPRAGHPRIVPHTPIYAYQELLIETSLLPADVRRGLTG